MSVNNLKKLSNEKTTIYLDPSIKKSVRFYALREDKSMSEIINNQLLEFLEDQDDIATYERARKEHETDGTAFTLEEVTKELGIDLDEIRNSARSQS